MDDKILINVYLPAVYKTFELFVPQDAVVKDIQKCIAKVLSELSDGMYIANEQTIMLDKSNGNILNINAKVAELQIRNGSQLMLI